VLYKTRAGVISWPVQQWRKAMSSHDPIHDVSQRVLERAPGEAVFTIRITEAQLVLMKWALMLYKKEDEWRKFIEAVENQPHIRASVIRDGLDDMQELIDFIEELQEKYGWEGE
jgi:hypothetical protein